MITVIQRVVTLSNVEFRCIQSQVFSDTAAPYKQLVTLTIRLTPSVMPWK